MLATTENNMTKFEHNTGKKWIFIFFVLLVLAIIAEVVVSSMPSFQVGYQVWPQYLNLNWAHQENLIQTFIDFFLRVWLLFTAVFFGGWLLSRSIRKLRGKSWLLEVKDSQRGRFFPPVLIYLKLSCLFLIAVFLFVIFQYPLQFIF